MALPYRGQAAWLTMRSEQVDVHCVYLSIYLCFVITGIMNVTGGIIHDQSEVDTDTSIQERIALGIGQFNCAGFM